MRAPRSKYSGLVAGPLAGDGAGPMGASTNRPSLPNAETRALICLVQDLMAAIRADEDVSPEVKATLTHSHGSCVIADIRHSGGMDVSLMRDVVEELAPIARLPTSPGEREAAHRIAVRMQEVGCTVAVHDEPAFSSYAWPVGLLSAVGVGSAVLAGRGRRAVGAVGGALAALGVVD